MNESCRSCGTPLLIDVSRIDGRCDDCRGRGDERPADLFRHVGVEVGAPLPPFAWPGGYLLVYSTRDGASVCADCANKTDTADPAVSVVVDEEKNCPCSHAQSEHAKAPAGQIGEGMGGACERCDCPAYWPLTCDDCGRPLDPADRSA